MARENSFNFFGKVENPTVVLFNDETKSYRVTFTMKTVRRNGRSDYPKINIYGLDEASAKEYVKRLQPEVYVQVRGMVTTKMVKKPVKCEACGEVNLVDTLQTEVITYGNPFVSKEKIDPIAIAEFANVGNVIGSVCTDIQRKDGSNGPTAAQFQIAVNRRYRVSELEKGTRTDYPWVKTFGETAEECLKRLQKSSQIYVTGAFQTRDINRRVKCVKCGCQLSYAERVGEIIPNGVEFLNNCIFAPRTQSEEDKTNEKD